MTQKQYDQMVKDTKWSIDYHEKELMRHKAIFAGLQKITHKDVCAVSND